LGVYSRTEGGEREGRRGESTVEWRERERESEGEGEKERKRQKGGENIDRWIDGWQEGRIERIFGQGWGRRDLVSPSSTE